MIQRYKQQTRKKLKNGFLEEYAKQAAMSFFVEVITPSPPDGLKNTSLAMPQICDTVNEGGPELPCIAVKDILEQAGKVEKVIQAKCDKLYVKWKGYNNPFNICIDKKRYRYVK